MKPRLDMSFETALLKAGIERQELFAMSFGEVTDALFTIGRQQGRDRILHMPVRKIFDWLGELCEEYAALDATPNASSALNASLASAVPLAPADPLAPVSPAPIMLTSDIQLVPLSPRSQAPTHAETSARAAVPAAVSTATPQIMAEDMDRLREHIERQRVIMQKQLDAQAAMRGAAQAVQPTHAPGQPARAAQSPAIVTRYSRYSDDDRTNIQKHIYNSAKTRYFAIEKRAGRNPQIEDPEVQKKIAELASVMEGQWLKK